MIESNVTAGKSNVTVGKIMELSEGKQPRVKLKKVRKTEKKVYIFLCLNGIKKRCLEFFYTDML